MNEQPANWVDIAALEDVPKRGARLIKTAHGCVAVFRTGADEVYALDNACPHKQGPLADGIVHDKSVTCPLHNWVISLETGEVQGADEGQVATYPAKVVDGRITLDTAFLVRRAVA
ncbi:assimilatory nitrite reductase (NAD(P)H) small subunit [Octadecabacter temperatus]|uniref:Assimilatory nitrite reductase [NAD(P)H] small subunit n=1 Tax=Octadecabacter temperatus TaxID=1458307 RepID=A0A0K0Y4U9_9RHOB|nr:nitrite reductase small subunit NirD [Octadecabacter temperatus]AKS46023.1 Assimilatory nitrite reductase [NAD(P)H] small subunit [Octadecabacter temperatus]SIO05890.1 assimilatory nitrite reductase (NAD(P)H) small subunit [Octadecabacter temperatus]